MVDDQHAPFIAPIDDLGLACVAGVRHHLQKPGIEIQSTAGDLLLTPTVLLVDDVDDDAGLCGGGRSQPQDQQ
jgi:hypothetical protein